MNKYTHTEQPVALWTDHNSFRLVSFFFHLFAFSFSFSVSIWFRSKLRYNILIECDLDCFRNVIAHSRTRRVCTAVFLSIYTVRTAFVLCCGASLRFGFGVDWTLS